MSTASIAIPSSHMHSTRIKSQASILARSNSRGQVGVAAGRRPHKQRGKEGRLARRRSRWRRGTTICLESRWTQAQMISRRHIVRPLRLLFHRRMRGPSLVVYGCFGYKHTLVWNAYRPWLSGHMLRHCRHRASPRGARVHFSLMSNGRLFNRIPALARYSAEGCGVLC